MTSGSGWLAGWASEAVVVPVEPQDNTTCGEGRAAGVDEQSIAGFEADRDRNLYKTWNPMSSGSYFPPPVKAVEIPKAGGKGVRVLGMPAVADRIAQTAAKIYLEPKVEPVFHPDSYGYRPGKSALDAVAACRQRCWRADWVTDMAIRAFFDTVPWDLVLKAAARHIFSPGQQWIVLYVRRGCKRRCGGPMARWSPGNAGPRRGSAICGRQHRPSGPAMMVGVPDMRRRTPEPPPAAPEIQFKPGTANELLHELAPLLAEEGIDVDNIDVPDLDTLQRPLGRAIERRNMAMFTPIGQARELAAVTMRLAAEAIADGDTQLAASILDQAQPESPDGSSATVSACTGLALGLLDQWMSGNDTQAPAGLATLTRLPAGHWTGERAATDILTLARKGRAFASLDALIARQGGRHILYGTALVLAAALQAWSRHASTPVIDLARAAVR